MYSSSDSPATAATRSLPTVRLPRTSGYSAEQSCSAFTQFQQAELCYPPDQLSDRPPPTATVTCATTSSRPEILGPVDRPANEDWINHAVSTPHGNGLCSQPGTVRGIARRIKMAVTEFLVNVVGANGTVILMGRRHWISADR